jgi:hypothetical protein
VVKQGLIEGVELDSASTLEVFEACMKAKAMRQPFLEEMANCAHTYGELIHMDPLRQKALQDTYTISVSPMTLASKQRSD